VFYLQIFFGNLHFSVRKVGQTRDPSNSWVCPLLAVVQTLLRRPVGSRTCVSSEEELQFLATWPLRQSATVRRHVFPVATVDDYSHWSSCTSVNQSIIVRVEDANTTLSLTPTNLRSLLLSRKKRDQIKTLTQWLCGLVSIRGRLLFSIMWPEVKKLQPYETNYAKSATWRMDI